VDQYWKLQNNAWHQLTGATFAGNQVTFTLVDGADDGDGTVVDPGAPAVLAAAAPSAVVIAPRSPAEGDLLLRIDLVVQPAYPRMHPRI